MRELTTCSARRGRAARTTLRARAALAAAASVCGLATFAVLDVSAAPVNGTILGTGVQDTIGDDKISVSTIDVSYFTSCYFITNGISAGGFGAYSFVYAGQGAAAAVPNIDPGDFTVSQYKPWVGTNNAGTNNVTDPAGRNQNRDVANQEDGGCDIVISYKPSAATDPTTINFIQAFIISTNGGVATSGTIDNGGVGGPFYNERGVSGTGANGNPPIGDPARLNMAVTNAKAGWIVDIPLTPEFGYANQGDDTITSETDTFQTFISGQKVIGGTTYNVLYGGIQWGYSFTTEDVPEPGTATMAGGVVAIALVRRPRRY
jgi:hypothetical protein